MKRALYYIYIFEDGSVQKHGMGPSRIDQQLIRDGCLKVLRCVGDYAEVIVGGDGENKVIDSCKLESDEEGDWYHVPRC